MEEALAQVDGAVRVRLARGESIGYHLSGGIDSSTVVALVRRMLDQHIRRSQDHSSRIWELMVLEAWCRTFFDREAPLAGPLKFK